MKCGDKGHLTAQGQPCGQNINVKAAGCLWHVRSKKQRTVLATRGALAARLNKALPVGDPMPILQEGLPGLEAACRYLFGVSLKRNIDRWRLTEARGFLTLLFQAEDLKDRRKLYEAIVSLEHGGQAVILVNQFLEGQTGGRRRIPPKLSPVLEGQAS
ncbi:MAG: hypothetical protein IH977_04340 [Nitrospinae bacterium]|nr:hypothetical protein [Nitrospinota bacterium]